MRTFLSLLLVLLLAAGAGAQPLPASEEAETPASSRRPVPSGLASPRATLETFLVAMRQASPLRPDLAAQARECLDLSGIDFQLQEARGNRLIYQLYDILKATGTAVPSRLSGDPEAAPVVLWSSRPGKVELGRLATGEWKFTAATVAAIPAIHEELAARGRVAGETSVPAPLRIEFAGIAVWQWIGLAVLLLLGLVLDRAVPGILNFLGRSWIGELGMEREEQRRAVRPLGLLAAAVVWWIGLTWLQLPDALLKALIVAVKFLAATAGVVSCYRGVEVLTHYLRSVTDRTDSRFDDMLVPLIGRVLKVLVTFFGVLFIAQNLNINVWGLFAGFSILGAAAALAGQDIVKNFFGSIMVIVDRTFKVGDWVLISGNIEGTIESLGFRSTRIRTFANSLITLPNSNLITAPVENFGERQYRRYKTTIGILYSTPADKIEAFCEGIREIIRRHPYTRKDYYHIYLNDFGDSSLNILVYMFFETPDWATELRERHRFIVDIVRLAERLGVEFAFPTRTVHLFQGEPAAPGEDRLDAASREEALARGRSQAGELVRATLGEGEKPPPVTF